MNAVEFSNKLKSSLNDNANRYHGGYCNGRYFPNIETFDVDEVYDIIDRIASNISEDNCDSKTEYNHQEQPNESYFEEINDYYDGTMNV